MENKFSAFVICIGIAFFGPVSHLTAQISCGTNRYLQFISHNPGLQAKTAALNRQWVSYNRSSSVSRPNDEQLYTLPVVFHVIHKGGSENIPDAQVSAAFQALNDAFANQAAFDQGSGVDTRIRFCLAKTDPDGNYTTGITHTYADLLTVTPEINDALLKSLINWDPTRYINIWVVKEVDMKFETNTCGSVDLDVAGYATLPPSHGTSLDGIVIEADALASAITHEMGHYLGLYHTFEGGCANTDCLADGDQVCDTPPEQTVTNPCGRGDNSCNTDALSGFTTDQLDLETNFMDYGGSCQHDFTPGQKDRMRFMIENIRTSLLASGVCENDCSQPAEGEFEFTGRDYATGQTVSFTNTSTQANSYEWYVNNSFAGSSLHLDYTFPGQGWYKIELLAKPLPDAVKCRNKQLAWVRVFCSLRPYIQADKKVTVVNDPVHFTSHIVTVRNVPGPVTYQWYADDILFGNSAEADHSFDTPGKKIIYLVTSNGGCRDTSDKIMVDVKPLPDYTLNLDHLTCLPSDKNKVSFTICNNGFMTAPAGIPVTFYPANPTLTAAPITGSVFFTTTAIPRFCCEEFEIELPENFTGTYLYGVINDNHSLATPYNLATDFPVTAFHESDYTNNLDSLLMDDLNAVISPGGLSEVVIGNSISLTGIANQPASFTWSADNGTFSCTTCPTVLFEPVQYTRVFLEAVTEGGCVDRDTAIIKVLADQDILIPSAFTPNQDNLNDMFYIMGNRAVENINSFLIFNRWGQQVFARHDILPNIPSLGWDGDIKDRKAPSAVYVYLVTVLFKDGKKKNYKGTVTLIR